MKKEILAIIPARHSSKSIPRKNMVLLYGEPLIQYTINAAKRSKLLSRIILSSDGDEIIDYCKNQGIEVPFKRPSNLALDYTPMIDVIKHAVDLLRKKEGYKPDYIILLQPTSPLRTAQHIDESLKKLIDSNADSIVSVVEISHQFNPYSVMELKNGFLKHFLPYDEKRNIRQLKPKFYARNGAAIYAFTYECLLKKNSLYGRKILPYFMKKEESVDIDDLFDLEIAEIALKLREKANYNL